MPPPPPCGTLLPAASAETLAQDVTPLPLLLVPVRHDGADLLAVVSTQVPLDCVPLSHEDAALAVVLQGTQGERVAWGRVSAAHLLLRRLDPKTLRVTLKRKDFDTSW